MSDLLVPPNSVRTRDGSQWPSHAAKRRAQTRRIAAMRRPGAMVAMLAEAEATREARRAAQRAARDLARKGQGR